jgi:hypothetical protein
MQMCFKQEGRLTSSLVVDYMHDAMNKILELFL